MRNRSWIPGRRRAALATLFTLAGGRLLAAPGGLPSNVGHADPSPEWDKLRAALFQDRPIVTDPARLQITAPLRAAYGASVPVKVLSKLPQTEALHVKRLTLLVDKNPSPLAAVFDLTPAMGQADLETRLRVDEYSHVRVIAELSTGELLMDSRYVKTSGGCSAPPNREHLAQLGKTVLRLPEGVRVGAPTLVDLTVVHPNDSGFELNNVTVMFIPPHFVRSIRASFGGRKLFDAELDFSIAENPNFRFYFVPDGPGLLRAEVEDSKDGRFVGTLLVETAAAVALKP